MTLEGVVSKRRVLVALPIFLVFAAWNRGNPLLYFLGALCTAIAVFAHVLPIVQLKRIAASRIVPATAREMTPMRWRVQVTNGSWLPRFMLEIVDRLPVSFGSSFSPHSAIDVVLPHRTRAIEEEVVLPRRGLYRLGPLTIRSAFPMGILEREHTIDDSFAETLVYPETFEIGTLPLPLPESDGWSATAATQKPGGDTDFCGIREYRFGDSHRRIHWGASARHGTLVVKEFERAAPVRRLMIVLNQERTFQTGEGRESRFEYQVRIAASVAEYCIRHGWEVGFVGMGAKVIDIAPSTGDMQLARVMKVFACVECDGQQPYGAAIHRAAAVAGNDALFVTFPDDTHTASAAAHGAELAIVLERDSFSDDAKRIPALRAVQRAEKCTVYRVARGQNLKKVFAQRG